MSTQPAPTSLVVMTHAELLALVRTAVREELATAREPTLLDVCASLPLSRRVSLNLCRAGKIHGAKKVGKRWLARREDIEAFLATTPVRPRALAANSNEPWTPEAALARAGVRSQ